MKNSPLFSILVANYNNSHFLADCVTSIFKQEYTNWEVIFVDDCSSDDSLETINRLRQNDERIRTFVNDKNMGCGFTKKRCVNEASGELCGFLDPDDKLSLDALKKMVIAHEKFPAASLVCSRYFICNRNMKITGLSGYVRKDGFSNLLEMPWKVSHFTTFKRSEYLQTEGISDLMKRAIDQDLYLKLEEVGEIEFLNLPLYYFRKNENSISLNKNQYKAIGWHLFAIMQACKRRQLDFDDYCTILKSGKIKKTFFDPLVSCRSYFHLKANLIKYYFK